MADTAHPYLADVGCAVAFLDKIADRDPTFLSISEKRGRVGRAPHPHLRPVRPKASATRSRP